MSLVIRVLYMKLKLFGSFAFSVNLIINLNIFLPTAFLMCWLSEFVANWVTNVLGKGICYQLCY